MNKIYALKKENPNFKILHSELLNCIQDAIIWGNEKLIGINNNMVDNLQKLMYRYINSYNNKEDIKY